MVRRRPLLAAFMVFAALGGEAWSEPADPPLFPSYQGRVMCGYQGWFRAEGDEAGVGWGHFGTGRRFDPEHVTIDAWPDVTEYAKTYETAFVNADGSKARVFSSVDASAADLHFAWMKAYGIDGAFMQRFFDYGRSPQTRRVPDRVLRNAFEASQKHERAIAVMYDLSGLRPGADDCSIVIADWKHLVDDLKVKKFGARQTYLHHNGRPLVAVWGIGFPDRPYDIRKIGIDKLIGFLKDDPVYGGCSVMLGVPTYFRDLDSDCARDPYLHDLIRSVDVVMPWMVGRFTLNLYGDMNRYASHVEKDVAWCASNRVDYAPCVYPGFSWHNLSKIEFGGANPLNQIPRHKGRFFWQQASTAIEKGAAMLYVAMFDEMDEGTAIFKCSNTPPVNGKFIDMEGLPADFYLKLAGRAGRMLRREIPFSKELDR